MRVMESVKLLALSEKQVEDLRNLFSIWMKQKGDILTDPEYATRDDCASFFLKEVADAIICNVSIMTREERDKDRYSFYCSMEGLQQPD
jgi:hypothetical protein